MNEILRREQQPRINPVGMPFMPEPVRHLLPGGAEAWFLESGTEDIIRMEFIFHAGQVMENVPLLAGSVNMMLQEGSENHTSEELHRELDYYGAFLHLYSDKDYAGMVIFCLGRHIGKMIDLAAEIMFRPSFPESELNALMKKRLQWYRINREKIQHLATDRFHQALFGKSHQYGRQARETDFSNITTDLLRSFHNAFYRPGNMTVIISGRIPEKTVSMLGERFGTVETLPFNQVENISTIKSERKKRIHISRKKSVQTAIRIGSATINKRQPDYHGLKVVDSILGGYFGSRLMKNIREEKGYTYGIRSGITSLDLTGYKAISTEVGSRFTTVAIDEIIKEIRKLQDTPVGTDELETVRNYMTGEMVRMFDGPFALAETFRSAWEFGLGFSYYEKFFQKIRTIDPGEIMEIARKYYKVEDLYIVTAGQE